MAVIGEIAGAEEIVQLFQPIGRNEPRIESDEIRQPADKDDQERKDKTVFFEDLK